MRPALSAPLFKPLEQFVQPVFGTRQAIVRIPDGRLAEAVITGTFLRVREYAVGSRDGAYLFDLVNILRLACGLERLKELIECPSYIVLACFSVHAEDFVIIAICLHRILRRFDLLFPKILKIRKRAEKT